MSSKRHNENTLKLSFKKQLGVLTWWFVTFKIVVETEHWVLMEGFLPIRLWMNFSPSAGFRSDGGLMKWGVRIRSFRYLPYNLSCRFVSRSRLRVGKHGTKTLCGSIVVGWSSLRSQSFVSENVKPCLFGDTNFTIHFYKVTLLHFQFSNVSSNSNIQASVIVTTFITYIRIRIRPFNMWVTNEFKWY